MNTAISQLEPADGAQLVSIARHSLNAYLLQQTEHQLDLTALPPALQAVGTAFVTLTRYGQLRGCIGNCEARGPLAEAVAQHAISAAIHDPRFAPVEPDELSSIRLEVTVLTPLQRVMYRNLVDLLGKIRPFQDGVMLVWGGRRGVLLPQMWARIPQPKRFVATVAQKAGIPGSAFATVPSAVAAYVFQTQHFGEAD